MTDDIEGIIRRAVQPLEQQIGFVRDDAREARDGLLKLSAHLDGQNVTKQIEKLSASMLIEHSALRQDVVAAIGNVRSDIKNIDERVGDLEDDRLRRDGGSALVRALKDYAGWFVGIGAAAVALYEKLKVP